MGNRNRRLPNGGLDLPTMGEDITGTVFVSDGNEGYSEEQLNAPIVDDTGDYNDEFSDNMAHYILGKLPSQMEEGRYYSEEEFRNMVWDNDLQEMINESYSSPEAVAEFGPNMSNSGWIEEEVSNYIDKSLDGLIDKGYLIENESGNFMLNPVVYNTNFPTSSGEGNYRESEISEDIYSLLVR